MLTPLARQCCCPQVCGVAEAIGVGVHFNPLVQLDTKVRLGLGLGLKARGPSLGLHVW